MPTFEDNVTKLSHLDPKVDLASWDDDIDLTPWNGKFDLTPWVLFGSDWWNYLPDCPDEETYAENIHLESLFNAKQLDENADWFLGVKGPGPRPN